MYPELRASKELIDRATTERIPLVVRGMQYPCWRCRDEDLAVVAVHPEGMIGVNDVVPTEGGLALAYSAELLAEAGHPQAATIKLRRSRSANETYLSNGCIHCDAIFGQFFVAEEVMAVLAAGTVSSLPALITVQRPAIEWFALTGLSATSDNLI